MPEGVLVRACFEVVSDPFCRFFTILLALMDCMVDCKRDCSTEVGEGRRSLALLELRLCHFDEHKRARHIINSYCIYSSNERAVDSIE